MLDVQVGVAGMLLEERVDGGRIGLGGDGVTSGPWQLQQEFRVEAAGQEGRKIIGACGEHPRRP